MTQANLLSFSLVRGFITVIRVVNAHELEQWSIVLWAQQQHVDDELLLAD